MSGFSGAHHFVLSGLGLAPGVTGNGLADTLHMLEHSLDPPKAAAGNYSGLLAFCRGSVHDGRRHCSGRSIAAGTGDYCEKQRKYQSRTN
jgi:hypothetical protein